MQIYNENKISFEEDKEHNTIEYKKLYFVETEIQESKYLF